MAISLPPPAPVTSTTFPSNDKDISVKCYSLFLNAASTQWRQEQRRCTQTAQQGELLQLSLPHLRSGQSHQWPIRTTDFDNSVFITVVLTYAVCSDTAGGNILIMSNLSLSFNLLNLINYL